MSRSFKCKLCGIRLSVDSSNDASPLLEHIITAHPEIKIPDSVAHETAEDVEEAKRKNQLHIPKNKVDQIKKPVSGDNDKSKGQSIENIPQTPKDKKMSSPDKTSKSPKTSDSPMKLSSKTSKTNSDKVTKDINDDTNMKNKNSTQNTSIADSKSRISQDKASLKDSKTSVDKDHKPLISKSVSRSSQDTKSENKNLAKASHNSVSKPRGDSKSSLNKGFNEKDHSPKSPKFEDPNKASNPQEPKNSVGKMRILKPENHRASVSSTVSEDVYHTPRNSLDLPSKPKDSKADVKKSAKDKNDKPHASKSKSQTSQELSSDSKTSASKKQSVKSKNHRNSADTISSTKTENSHRNPNDPIELPTKKHADSMASGDETSSIKFKDNVPKSTKRSNAPLAMQAYDTKYRYSIEKWKPGSGQIVCPKCGMRQRPIIRTRADKKKDKTKDKHHN